VKPSRKARPYGEPSRKVRVVSALRAPVGSCVTGKKRFGSKADARRQLRAARKTRRNGQRDPVWDAKGVHVVECAVYECALCGGGWHLTTRPQG
jgi:hypothetical protein